MMTLYPHICFVGQAPSKGAWRKCVKLGGVGFAVKECHRLALAGRMAQKLGAMLDMSAVEFCIAFRRENLNSRFPGKRGKGDDFNLQQGEVTASVLQTIGIEKFVLLGAKAARCFNLNWKPLAQFKVGGAKFLLLPHPSGINLWWNSKRNRAAAKRALREFVVNE